MNVYAYVRNIPQTLTDPLGLFELNFLSHNVVKFSVCLDVIHEPGTGDGIQGLNISIGPSIGVPFGVQIPILPFPAR